MLAGCALDAPHDNPLDPESASYRNAVDVTGTVTTFYAPYRPISSVLVLALSSGSASLTDQNGRFKVSALPTGEYDLSASKTGYAADTVRITVRTGTVDEVSFHLDALPTFSNLSATTSHIAQWWPGEIYQADFAAVVVDDDGTSDIDSVFVVVDSIRRSMSYSPIDRRFHASLKSDELPSSNLHWLDAKPILILARDRPGNAASSPELLIVRIIEETPVAVSPSGLDTASASPTLGWIATYQPYPFTYEVEVVRVDAGYQTSVWKQTNIVNTSTSISVTTSLSTGTYYWTLAIVDEYGNRSRSKEASFIVQ
jgi:hypothetical protein